MDSFIHSSDDLSPVTRGERAPMGTPKSDPAFDRWLTHYLGRLYDPVVQEPLPDSLVRMLEMKLGRA
jgi:hypothetical protein